VHEYDRGCNWQLPGMSVRVNRTFRGFNNCMPIYALGDLTPTIHPQAYVHPDAVVIGDVTVGADSTVWPTAVLRGDRGRIVIGESTSIQDGSIIHCTADHDTVIGSRCVVGHRVHMEGCVIEDDCLIGSGSVLLHRVVVRTGALVGAQALLSNGTEVPSRAMALGVPAKIRLDAVQPGAFATNVAVYVENGRRFRTEQRRIG
jgi:carbonic anhydrase/acetyltransferase-like protein (isoleucine patch superfamily)